MKFETPFNIASIISLTFIVSACGFQSYTARPIDTKKVLETLQDRSTNNTEFQAYLSAQDYPENKLPISIWGENELTLSALFFHPDLNLARAQLKAAQASETTAAERPEIGLNGSQDRHSQHENKSPWTYHLGIDIPIVTAGKRDAQIARASGLTEASRIEIAQAAWRVHSRVARTLLDYQYLLKHCAILKNEVELRSLISDMLVKRMDAGMASSIEVTNARIALQKAEQAYISESGRIPVLGATLANDAGLSLSTFKKIKLKPYEQASTNGLDDLQYEALINRLDIRASLARYEAAEAKLRLEIAKQYPDIILSPSKTLDQGDKIWSLGFSSLLTLINKNRGMIAEATSLREVEIAQFEVLQAKVIGDLNETKAAYLASIDAKIKAQSLADTQQKRSQQTERQFNAGFTDRLEFTNTKLENIIAQEITLSTDYQVQIAKLNLEDVLQRPLDNRLTMPSNLDAESINENRNK